MFGPNEFEDHLLMDDFDIEDLMECDDVEMTPFLSSSKQLLSVIDKSQSLVQCLFHKMSPHHNGTQRTLTLL